MTSPYGVPDDFIEKLNRIPGNKTALRYLIQQLRGDGVVIYAGLGVSEGAGIPRWPNFVENLAHRAGIITSGKTTETLRDEIVSNAGELFFYDAVEEAYSEPPLDRSEWTGALPILPWLSPKAVTVNRDTAIEASYSTAGMPFSTVAVGSLGREVLVEPFLWKLNGTVGLRETLLPGQDSVRSEIAKQLTDFEQANSLFYIGVTPGEFLVFGSHTASRTHYATFAESDGASQVEFSRRNIRPIYYPDGRGGEEFLIRYLAKQSQDAKRLRPPFRLPPFIPKTAPQQSAVVLPTITGPGSATAPPSAKSIDLIEVPQDLIDACRAEECVLFAGAGLSARSGAPTWNIFLSNLIDFAQQHKILDPDYAVSLQSALREGERDAAADAVVQSFGDRRNLLVDFMRQTFAEPAPLSAALQRLSGIPFAAAVTTNYDQLLELAFPEFARSGIYTPKDAEALLDGLSQKRRFLLKLYGVIERPETLIFAPIEYRDVVAANISYSKFIDGLFFSRNFFFVGLSLEGIQDFLSGFVFRGANPRKHFALAAVEGSAARAKADLLLRRYNIQVIPVPVSDTFPEVDDFLDRLSRAAPQPAPAAPGTAPPPAPVVAQGIRKLILEDIGPFPRLEINFSKDKNWKVVLGDNGVGKSTILKAIATAMLGSDAKSYAARLVRAGATRGRITLTTEKNPTGYITEIQTKDMTSEAEVLSIPGRAMEAEGWLTLGFSPLRVVTWAASSGAQAIIHKGRPSADDLIPLLTGEPDPRMDRLKQWIVNLDNAEKTGRGVWQEFRTLFGHIDRVSCVAFSADGRLLVSGSLDNTVRVWDGQTGHSLGYYEGHSGGVNGVAVSADGAIAVSGSFDKTMIVWDTKTGQVIRTLEGSQSQILSVALTANGRKLFSGSEGGSVREWNLGTGRNTILAGFGPVWSVAASADGNTVAACSEDGKLLVWKGRGDPTTFDQTAQAVALTPNGRIMVSGDGANPIAVWDLTSGKVVRTLFGLSGEVMDVAISADGQTVVAASKRGFVCLWENAATSPTRQSQVHSAEIWAVALSPDGRTVASASADKTVKLWSLSPPEPGPSPAETIAAFFRLVGTITDRKDIEFLRVTENFRVLVKTADVPGGVPVEVLSQGLTSLFGWIGVLCQRLKETLQTPTGEALPTNSYALVLIDEIDAHMHPRWQQVLVHRLKQAFPNVQFVACTHSPLIVGGLDKEEIVRFGLDEGRIVPLDFDPDSALGRTDQILVAELFGLQTTLDPLTQEKIREYQRLLRKPKADRNAEEQRRFLELNRELEERIPPSAVMPVERRARELLRTLQRITDPIDLNDKDVFVKVENLVGVSALNDVLNRMGRLSESLRRENPLAMEDESDSEDQPDSGGESASEGLQ